MKYSIAIVALGSLAVCANAQVVMDQIGGNVADLTGNGWAAQDFEAAFNANDVAAIDDFTIGSAQNIVKVEAVLFGFTGLANFNNVTGYRVEFYTSVAAGAGSLVGNAASQTVAAGGATLTPYGSFPPFPTAIVSIPVNVNLAAGTYWVGVIPVLDFTGNGQTGIGDSTFGAGFPNGLNSFQVNPGGAFAFPGNQQQIAAPNGANLAYRLTAAPVPEPMTMTVFAAALGVLAARRRKRS